MTAHRPDRPGGTAWDRGRFDARRGPRKLLFGRMHEDSSIELEAFPPGTRVFCVASAGCTAIALAARHDVVAVDVNPVQIAYVRSRLEGRGFRIGAAERFMALARALAPAVGWTRRRVLAFVGLDDTAEQTAYWRRFLDTVRFRAAMDAAFSIPVLRTVYAPALLRVLPPRFGRILRGRWERTFSRHANRRNPFVGDLFLGEPPPGPASGDPARIRLVHADAASFLEESEPAGFHGFSFSNILDGADGPYAERLSAAVRRAAAPGAVVVIRSFGDGRFPPDTNRAADDRSMLWGSVNVLPAEAF